MKPDSIPELKGKVARAFEAKISKATSPRQKWILKEAVEAYKKIKCDTV
jgi:hypothetical protein